MSLTLEQFAAQCRQALKADPDAKGRIKVGTLLEEALKDQTFVETCVNDNTSERDVIYVDPELGFAIVAHNYTGPKTATPHDHADSWAVYGQARGETEMSDFHIVEPATAEKAGKVKVSRTYSLKQGDAHVYQVGDLHSPSRSGPTRLIRIEGRNMAGVKRKAYECIS
jgi:hypothetical protein